MKIGSRGSALALWQARWVASQVGSAEIVIIKTTGDHLTEAPLAWVGGAWPGPALPGAPAASVKGLFVKEIEEALIEGRIDLAVHSLKDLPVELDPRLVIAAIPARQDPRDALAGSKLADLPHGAKVGTSSLRRAAQLRFLRPDLRVENLRGNVDTRLRKLDQGQYQAIVLAAAGLQRLDLNGRIAELLDPETMCPAIGQGALAIETRHGDQAVLGALAGLEDAATRTEVTAERALLAELGGGCQVPIGGSARWHGESLRLRAVVASPDGARLVGVLLDGPAAEPAELGRRAARDLLARGAREILDQVYAA